MNLKLIFIGFILLLVGKSNLTAQIFATQYRQQFTYATTLSYPADGNYRVMALGAKPGFYPTSKIFVYNSSLILSDSILLLNGTIPQRNEPLKLNNRLFWPVVYYDTLLNSGGKFSVLELDTNYKYVALHKLSSYHSTSFLSNINVAHISNRLFVSFVEESTGFPSNIESVIYKLDFQFSKLDSVKYSARLVDMYRFDNSLMVSGFRGQVFPCQTQTNTTMKMAILDTSFVPQNCYSFDSLGSYFPPNFQNQKIQIRPLGFCGKTIPLSRTKVLAVGSAKFGYQFFSPFTEGIVNAILTNSNQIINVSVIGNSVTNTNYFENSNFVAVKNDEIITVGCIGNDFQYPFATQPQKTKILINKFDTIGNSIWTKEHGGDMFYQPSSVVFTPDGGCLIGGWRYDTTTMKVKDPLTNQDIYESFLLKLGANGEIFDVGIFENGKINRGIKSFPNPSSDKIFFDIPFQDNIEIYVYSTLGSQVLKIRDYLNLSALDVSTLDKGVYFYKVRTKSNNYSGKFIKE